MNQTVCASSNALYFEDYAKIKVWIVADSASRAQHPSAASRVSEAEIRSVIFLAELDTVIQGTHDLALVDVALTELKDALQTLRTSTARSNIPVLVRHGRIAAERSLAGVLPKHRATPCNDTEMLALAQRRFTSTSRQWRARSIRRDKQNE